MYFLNISDIKDYIFNVPLLCQQEQTDLCKLFEKYVPSAIDMIVDGIVEGKQTEKLKTVIPQTDLNMVSESVEIWTVLQCK